MKRFAFLVGFIALVGFMGISRDVNSGMTDVATDSVASLAKADPEVLHAMSMQELWERAQWKDLDALIELSERYRYGRGSVEKSMVNALGYYGDSPIEWEDLMEEVAMNPKDEFGAFNHIARQIITRKESGTDPEVMSREILARIDSLPEPRPHWAQFTKEIIATPSEERAEKYIDYLLDPTDGDSFFMALMLIGDGEDYTLFNLLEPNNPQYLTILNRLTDKVPILSDPIAHILLKRYAAGGREHFLREAMEFYHKIDNIGMLGRPEMLDILKFAEKNGEDTVAPFTKCDLTRFNVLCPPEFREIYEDPTIPIEEVEDE